MRSCWLPVAVTSVCTNWRWSDDVPRYEPIDWYDAPRWYDLVFGEDTLLETTFLEQVVSRYGRSRGRRVLEPACGSGRLVAELASRGWRVTGFDRNVHMLRFARARLGRRGLRATLFEADMASFETPGRFDLAHCLVSTFKYLHPEAVALQHLRRVAAALRPGGVYVLGFHLSEYGTTHRSRERWVARRGATEVTCNIQIWPPEPRTRRERVRSRLIVRRGATLRRFETEWTFFTYDAEQVRRLLARVPQLAHVATYDFTYSLDAVHELDDEQLDVVLILRRR